MYEKEWKMNRGYCNTYTGGCAFCPILKESVSLKAVCGLYLMGILTFDEWKEQVAKMDVPPYPYQDDTVTADDV